MSAKTNSKSAFDDEFEDPDMPFYEESPPPTDPTALLLAGQRQNEKGIRTPYQIHYVNHLDPLH